MVDLVFFDGRDFSLVIFVISLYKRHRPSIKHEDRIGFCFQEAYRKPGAEREEHLHFTSFKVSLFPRHSMTLTFLSFC